MDSESKLENILNQCRHNGTGFVDVDVKIDGLNKLQAEIGSGGVEIIDSEAIISVLKACLRTSNQHLTTATLSVLPSIFPALISKPFHLSLPHNGQSSTHSSTSSSTPSTIVDAYTLRQALNAFLPTGGLLDRLGDREKAQQKAREALVVLGGLAFRAPNQSTLSTSSRGGKGIETPLAIFERCLRDIGLSSKVWKVREQSILTLVHIRRQHHMFPIRPYLPLLVGCLEDMDAHVRDCARTSVVELFSGPAVTDAARADLKKELTKRGVRKTIVDGVLSKLLGAGSSFDGSSNPTSREGSENGDPAISKPKEYVPPSIALQQRKPSGSIPRMASQASAKEIPRPLSRAASATSPPPATPTSENSSSDVSPVYIASARDLENEFASMAKPFDGKETEHNWSTREQAIQRVRGMLKGDVHNRYLDVFLACLKDGFIQWSLKTLASLRTTVAINTCFLYSELATSLGHLLDPFAETLLTSLLKMAGFTKKLTAQQSQVSVTSLINNTSATPRFFVTLLWQTLQEKTVQTRTYAAAHFKTYIEVHGQRIRHAPEAEVVEKAVRKCLADPNPTVKEKGRGFFWAFHSVWPDRGGAVMESLDNNARKQLEKACPDPNAAPSMPSVAPTPAKKSSVAAAIAASRAKAKAIAAAPPSLRHQATSASHGPVRRPASPSAMKSTPSTPGAARPASPLRMSASPPSPRSRIVSNPPPRPAPAPIPQVRHSNGASTIPAEPPSPSFHRRMSSSPLAQPNAARRASQIPLPPSPPSSISSPPRQSIFFKPAAAKPLSIPTSLAGRPSGFTLPGSDDDSLLLAQAIPLPDEDTDSDDHSVNLLSFSSPSQRRQQLPPPIRISEGRGRGRGGPPSNSRTQSLSPRSVDSKAMMVSNALSTDSVADLNQAPVVEDALRARAEQAESAAERLLELVEPEEDLIAHSGIPPELLLTRSGSGHSTPKVSKTKPSMTGHGQGQVLITPLSDRASNVLRQAALFKDSPVPANGRRPTTSLLDTIQDRKHETGWWLTRKSVLAQQKPADASSSDQDAFIQECIKKLEDEGADIAMLQQLVHVCLDNPANDTGRMSPLSPFPTSPSPFSSNHSMKTLHADDIWEKNRNFDRLFNALNKYLVSESRTESEIEHGLMVLWQMHESLAVHLEGREAGLFSVLLSVRYCNKFNILEATNTIRDALTSKIEPVYGLTTMHASLKVFHSEPPRESAEVKNATYAFGLIAIGKFILRLPAEIAEEELPRIKGTLISALNDTTSLVVREAAAAAIISAQLVLRDETHLFTLLDGLADEKKNLLTYLFDKHGVRGSSSRIGPNGLDKLQKEMRRLDTRTSTPPRSLV
ncbi:suppressor of tub2 mutation [Marasmius crinis-equi]|uniref:Suppressor of tub2 mutation n=1 Tax=Marasmius crinis-equi TaxID=585013 RepID=A0ABR3FAA6_9AGAR